MNHSPSTPSAYLAIVFRVALFAAAFSLAAYIVYQYAATPHAEEGFYAVLFPLSSLLALAGMVFAVKPRTGCNCNVGVRAGLGALSVVWIATGVMCLPMLLAWIGDSPAKGGFALFHMVAQHVFLSLSLLGFVFFPRPMSKWLVGAEASPPPEQSEEATENLP